MDGPITSPRLQRLPLITLYLTERCNSRCVTCDYWRHGRADMERECAADFASGFIAESPAKLRRLLQYFAAIHGKAPYPLVRCNAPEFSAVVGASGAVRPCFFISGRQRPRACAAVVRRSTTCRAR